MTDSVLPRYTKTAIAIALTMHSAPMYIVGTRETVLECLQSIRSLDEVIDYIDHIADDVYHYCQRQQIVIEDLDQLESIVITLSYALKNITDDTLPDIDDLLKDFRP